MRYLATAISRHGGLFARYVCDIEGDHLLAERNVGDVDPALYATIPLKARNSSAAHLFNQDEWILESLPPSEQGGLMPPTTGTARATLLRFVEEWVPYTLDLDANLDDDKLVVLVAAICAERKLRLPGVAAAVAALCGVAE